jgi:hypothetical protein
MDQVRVVGLRSQSIPETGTLEEAFEARADVSGNDLGQFQDAPREQDPHATVHDARGDGERRGLDYTGAGRGPEW